MKEQRLKDRVILVTGAGSGIGRTAALTYAEEGATVILLGRTPQTLEKVYDDIIAMNAPEPAILPLDLKGARLEDYELIATTIEKELGRLDGILHNAGWLGSLTPLSQYPLQQWFDAMQINLNAPFLLTQALLPLLKQSPDAAVLFTVDGVAQEPKAYWGAYGIAKAGLTAMMKIWADELEANTTVRVNAINPGPVATHLRGHAYPFEDASLLAKPESLMYAYVYWMGPESTGKTGQWVNCQE